MGYFIFKKTIDQSLLNTTMTIPIENHQEILEELGFDLNKGDKRNITIKMNGHEYEATIRCVDYSEKYSERTVIQIRYRAKSPICKALNSIFKYSADIIAQKKTEGSGKKKQLSVEEEYIDVFSAGKNTLEFKCHTKEKASSAESGKEVLIRPVIEQLLNNYVKSKQEIFAEHIIGAYIRKDAPEALYQTGLIDRQNYLITGSVGQGNWATIPWLSIFDKRITTTATQGVYIVYLLAEDGNSMYLTLNQGCKKTRSGNSRKETIRILREEAKKIISCIDSRGFATDEEIDLGDSSKEPVELYQKGTIFYKKYMKGNVPEEEELRDDLSHMMDIYHEYEKKMTKKKKNKTGNQSDTDPKAAPNADLESDSDTASDMESDPPEEPTDSASNVDPAGGPDIEAGGEPQGEEEQLETKEVISRIKKYIKSKGFTYSETLIENFYLSLKSKPFVILAGISGTGKTRLVRLFAEAIGATAAESGGNGRYKLVSVRPDWSDSSDLFGHTNLKGEFVPGAILDFVKEAGEHLDQPYFLCLDEMNLARVEYYLSDFLSVIETRRHAGGRIVTDQIHLDKAAEKAYGRVILPENLYVVGTVNMDETTFPFSRKVLDRANTIEFSYVNLEPEFELERNSEFYSEIISPEEKADLVPRRNAFLKTEYLVLKTDIKKEQKDLDLATRVCGELQAINDILQKANAHVGYRVRDEIVFYMLNNEEAGLLEYTDALDNEIMQKILPRIQGSSTAVKELLCGLFQKFAGDYRGLSQDMIWKQMEAYIDSRDCVYRKSAEKICYMMRRYEEDGFTSYWL